MHTVCSKLLVMMIAGLWLRWKDQAGHTIVVFLSLQDHLLGPMFRTVQCLAEERSNI